MSGCAIGERAKIKATDVVNTKTSDYYPTQPIDKNKRVFVFVHGIFGDAYETWQNKNGTYFFDLVKNDKSGVFTDSDIFVFGFPSSFFGSGSYTPDDAARSLAVAMRFSRVTDYRQIIFVAHSMGGLVTLRYLVLNPDVAAKVPLAFFYSTPQEGSNIAKLGSIFSSNPALNAMFPDRNSHGLNLYLGSLDEDWKNAIFRKQISTVIRCAYEKKPILGQYIVDEESATRFCQGSPYPIPEDHIDMVKPADDKAESYRDLYDAVSLIPNPNASVTLTGIASIASVGNLTVSATSPATIRGVSISFHTNDEDKDYDTWVNTQISCDGKIVAGQSQPYGKFPNNSENGPFELPIREHLTIDKNNSLCKLIIHINPNGHDTWRFNSKLDVTFTDNTHKIFSWNNNTLDQNNKDLELPMNFGH
jgi:hypothetical protein